jgi:hypothetical protein
MPYAENDEHQPPIVGLDQPGGDRPDARPDFVPSYRPDREAALARKSENGSTHAGRRHDGLATPNRNRSPISCAVPPRAVVAETRLHAKMRSRRDIHAITVDDPSPESAGKHRTRRKPSSGMPRLVSVRPNRRLNPAPP